MKRALLVLVIVSALLAPLSVSADSITTSVTYQGRLKQDGHLVTATCDFQLNLFGVPTGGTSLADYEADAVSVVDGEFTLAPDWGAQWDGQQRWVEAAVRCNGEPDWTALLPRTELTAAPYALYAQTAGYALMADTAGYAVSASTAITAEVVPWSGVSGAPTFQLRVTGTCDVGSYVRVVNADGSVTCGADAGGSSYSAGYGLDLTGSEFSVVTSTIQMRVAGTCSAGQYITAVAADGTVSCGTDAGGTSYSAGSGLVLTGTVFSADLAALQARVTGSCSVGQYVRAVAGDGTVTCGTDADTNSGGTVTGTGTAGVVPEWATATGLADSLLSVSGAGPLSLQNNVAGTRSLIFNTDLTLPYYNAGGISINKMAAGDVSLNLRASGDVAFGAGTAGMVPQWTTAHELDDSTLSITGSNGIVLANSSGFTNSLSLNSDLVVSRGPGSTSLWLNNDGPSGVTAFTVPGSGTAALGAGTLTASTPNTYTTSNHTHAIDLTTIQSRVTGTCGAGTAVSAIGQTGTVTCTTTIGARVYNSANITLTTGANTDLTFNSERFDTDGIHSTSSNTGRLMAQTTGTYLVTANVAYASNSTGLRQLGIVLNGSTILGWVASNPTTGALTIMSVSTVYNLTAGDYVTMRTYQSSGGDLAVVASANYSPEFSMVLLP